MGLKIMIFRHHRFDLTQNVLLRVLFDPGCREGNENDLVVSPLAGSWATLRHEDHSSVH